MVFALTRIEPIAEAVKKLPGPPPATSVTVLPGNWLKIAGTGSTENAFIYAVENPFGVDVMIVRTIHMLTTKGATASAVLDVGVDADGATGDDTILDGVTIGSGGTN